MGALALERKNAGNAYVAQGKYKRALICYEPGASFTEKDMDKDDREKSAKMVHLMLAALRNKSLCELKLKHFGDCIATCDKVLSYVGLDHCEKTLTRRATAKAGLGKFASAIEDWQLVREFYLENKDAEKKITELEQHAKRSKAKDKSFVKNMFK